MLAVAAVLAAATTAGGSAQSIAPGAETFTIGRSVQGRPIQATELGDPTATRKVLVVGVIHGDETAGRAVIRALLAAGAPPGTDLWLVDELNPDGVARGTRQNARGVDLNRNFPWRWRGGCGPATRSTRAHACSPSPSRAPPTASSCGCVRASRSGSTSRSALVDESGGSLAIERSYAEDVGLPLRRLPRYHGSATSWQNARLPGSTAFVVELPGGPLAATAVARQRDAVLALAGGG